MTSASRVVITDLPMAAKKERLQLKFAETRVSAGVYDGCWGIDGVRLSSGLFRPQYIEDNMEGFMLDSWIFPGLIQVSFFHLTKEVANVDD